MKKHVIDAKGMQCPKPIVEVFKASKKLKAGEIIEVEATDKGFASDIKAWCKKTSNELVSLKESNSVLKAVIRKK
jgi:tRNA 2-thiouridine synthesizing protein A